MTFETFRFFLAVMSPTTPHFTSATSDEDAKAGVSRFMHRYTIETTPAGARRIADFRDHLAEGTWVYITSLPGSDFLDTVDTSVKLAREGMVPVPHFAARSIADTRSLDECLRRVTAEANVSRILAIGGSARESAGQFADTISMLETGLFDKHGIRSIGFGGHPEGIPGVDAALVHEHELRKMDFARRAGMDMYIVTQFVFAAAPVIRFVERLRSAGNDLPVVVGLPGLATAQSLIRYARTCGIGPSMQFLARRARDLRKLLTVQAPDRLVLDLARHRDGHGAGGIAGAHIYPFGGFEKSAAWANLVAAGEIEIEGDGFAVTG